MLETDCIKPPHPAVLVDIAHYPQPEGRKRKPKAIGTEWHPRITGVGRRTSHGSFPWVSQGSTSIITRPPRTCNNIPRKPEKFILTNATDLCISMILNCYLSETYKWTPESSVVSLLKNQFKKILSLLRHICD